MSNEVQDTIKKTLKGLDKSDRSIYQPFINKLIWLEYKEGRGVIEPEAVLNLIKHSDAIGEGDHNSSLLILSELLKGRVEGKRFEFSKIDKDFTQSTFEEMVEYKKCCRSSKEEEFLRALDYKAIEMEGKDQGWTNNDDKFKLFGLYELEDIKPDFLGKLFETEDDAEEWLKRVGADVQNNNVFVIMNDEINEEDKVLAVTYDKEDTQLVHLLKALQIKGIKIENKGLQNILKNWKNYYDDVVGVKFVDESLRLATRLPKLEGLNMDEKQWVKLLEDDMTRIEPSFDR